MCIRDRISHRTWHSAKQRGHLRAGLGEAEDVVDENQNVLVLDVAEILGDGETGQPHTQTRARRLVHLTVDERRRLEYARLLHLEIQIVPFARPLAHAAEYGPPAVP